MSDFKEKTVFITGGSRGIGLEIGKVLSAQGANVVIAAKTVEPNPKLPGTLFTAAEEIQAQGGQCLPLQLDIRDEVAIQKAVEKAAQTFGGIDILINNASAIHLTPTEYTEPKRFDLMFSVNVRGTYMTTQACLPYLKESAKLGKNPHILNLSPPLNMNPAWFAAHVAYTMAKYGMSMCVLGHASEFKPYGIAVNALWPQTPIYTAALQKIPMVKPEHCRTADIMSDAALVILSKKLTDPQSTGQFFIDEDVLKAAGIHDMDPYSMVPGSDQIQKDFFLD